MGSPALPLPRLPGPPQGPGTPVAGPGAPVPSKTPAVCTGVPLLSLGCARLIGTVGPPGSVLPSPDAKGKPGPPANNAADVLLIQKLINLIVRAGYMENSVLTGENGKLGTPLLENGQWSNPLFQAIKQIEVLYFHGRANPHGIGVIDPQADESMFVFLVGLANGSQKAKSELSVQMKALAVAMIPQSRVKIDAGGTAPDGRQYPARMEAVDLYLPILLDALTAKKLNDTDMVLVALACVFTETSNFVPVSEKMYDLNTTGTFTNNASGDTWTSTPQNIHGADYATLKQHYNAALKANPNFPSRGTETFTPNTLGPNGTTVQGNIYDSYVDSKGKTHNFNGNTQPGDGWKYRGRGLIQLTGRGQYENADQKAGTGTKFVDNPDLVNSREYAGVVVAGFLSWAEQRIRYDLAHNDLAAAREAVNGGTNGLAEFKQAMAAGRRVIGQAIIEEAKSSTRRKRTGLKHHKPKHNPHHPSGGSGGAVGGAR